MVTYSGYNSDREIARKQVDEKLVELGYELEKGD